MAEPTTPSPLTKAVADVLAATMDGPLTVDRLNAALRVLAKWRAQLLLNTIMQRDGTVVQSGPFAGMIYPFAATEGAAGPRLLGCYEASLTPVFEQIIAHPYRLVIDVGCAEGYYAIGLARRMKDAQILARDANPVALQNCAKLAAENGVAERIRLGGVMHPQDFDICADQATVVICDIEGAEADVLDPSRAKGLCHADILVETHDCITPGLCTLISNRFSATHHIQRFERQVNPAALPDWMQGFSDLDRLLALWEWRTGPTPWLWMTRKNAHG